MSNLIFFAVLYGIYSIWQALTGESSEWQNYTYQDSRAFRVLESVKHGKPYEETPFEKDARPLRVQVRSVVSEVD